MKHRKLKTKTGTKIMRKAQRLLMVGLYLAGIFLMQGQAKAQEIKIFKLHASTYSEDAKMFYKEEEKGERVLFTEKPFFKKVKFLKMGPPLSRRERVERIIYGIYTDVPPEYDYYGYEVRRYMSEIGKAGVFMTPDSVLGQLKNIKSAEIIFEYWRKELKKEMKDIEIVLKEKNEVSSTRTMFKYNRGVSNAFFIESKSWIENNRRLLKFLQKIGPKLYEYRATDGSITFRNKEDMQEFALLYESKISALKRMRAYAPFRMMVY